MANEQKEKSNRKVLFFIIFWLGVLTGALAVMLALYFSGIKDTGKASLLYYGGYQPISSTYLNSTGLTRMDIPTPPSF